MTPDQQAEEAAWVAQTLAGNQSAFAQLVNRYTGAVFNQAYRMLNNAAEAEDAVQEIFLRAYTRLASFQPERRFVTWLLAIGSNYCIDQLRRRRQQWLSLDDVAFWLPSDRPGPERSALQRERRDLIQEALQGLPDTYRMAAVLRFWHDLSYQEIAEALNLTESAVKTRLHRARAMLTTALAAEGDTEWEPEIAP
ncbi:MAG: sigma-70 family RNA polymerase sigma factor [Chloroflexaceae bacterium]|jgi:RNA polymerase sigma-70 factor (ECF subfamily)|nr:sigma-70 family RNA polymerase sigma factor [Chloroflexaceae bacterium]